jgi:hypothetical protein
MAFWDSLLSLGTGVLGGIGKQASNSATQTTTNTPWAPQSPYLLAGFQGAANAYNNAMQSPSYTGQLYAGINGLQNQAVGQTANFANGQASDVANGLINTSSGLLGSSANGLQDASSGLLSAASQDPTQQNIANAGAYADNPYLNGAIDAASRDVNRNLTEDVLPGINRNAAANGNTNSSRTGVAEGIALRGAQDRIGDIASTMRGDAYNQGLQQAEAARQANMQGLQSAGGLYNTALGNAMQGSAAGLTAQYGNLDALAKAGGVLQGNDQNELNAQYQAWQNQRQQPFDALNNYMGAIKGSYGNTGTTSSNNGQGNFTNFAQGFLGGAASGNSLYNNFKGIFGNSGS